MFHLDLESGHRSFQKGGSNVAYLALQSGHRSFPDKLVRIISDIQSRGPRYTDCVQNCDLEIRHVHKYLVLGAMYWFQGLCKMQL
jgi:hypothetical protein